MVRLWDFLLLLATLELFLPWLRDSREETFFLLDLERDFLAELVDEVLVDRFLLVEAEALLAREDFPPPARTEATCTDPFCPLAEAFPWLARAVLGSRFLEEATLREEALLDLLDLADLRLLDFFRV